MRRLATSLAVACLGGLALTGCHTEPTVSVSPSTSLLSGQEVTVSGGGYAPHTVIDVVQCPVDVDSRDDCFRYSTTATTDADGHFSAITHVEKVFGNRRDEWVSCSEPASCVMAVAAPGFQNVAAVPLTFSEVRGMAVNPSRNLVDGQTVNVVGEAPHGSVKVMQCPHETLDYLGCDMRTLQRPSISWNGGYYYFDTQMTVYEVIQSEYYGTTTDCSVPGSCVIMSDIGHGWSIMFPLATPISFQR